MPPKTSGDELIIYTTVLTKLIYIDSEMTYDCVVFLIYCDY